MGKRRASTRLGEEEDMQRRERRSKQRHEAGAHSHMVTPNISSLLRNEERINLFKKKLMNREILEYKHVNFQDLVKLFENQNVDVANYLAGQGWNDFVQLHGPVNQPLLRILIANLDESSMVSWVGKTRIDLSPEAWCNAFSIPNISKEEESPLMALSKEDLFFRLTGEKNLGNLPFIRINQLHQEANVRLSVQIVMNVLVPKKGSKEQIKVEEGRLLYAMVYGKQVNLARMIVERLKSVYARKSTPICYGMHLMEIMERAGVNLQCFGSDELNFISAIDHHTLQRLGYKKGHSSWDFVGKGKE